VLDEDDPGFIVEIVRREQSSTTHDITWEELSASLRAKFGRK
jgi:hypothetical protein